MDTTQIRKYLLNSLSEAESTQLEERLLTDDECYELLQAEEDELIDDYLSGALSPTEQQRFEQIFLAAPERRERLRLAQVFNRHLAQSPSAEREPEATEAAEREPIVPARQPWWRAWLDFRSPLPYATALLLVVISVGWWLSQRPAVKPLGTDTIPAFTLLPVSPRANTQTNRVALPPGTSRFRLELALETAEPGAYRAVLLNAAGQELSQWSGLRPFEKNRLYQIVLDVPNGTLPAGTYQLKLSVAANDGKLTDAEHYQFQITR